MNFIARFLEYEQIRLATDFTVFIFHLIVTISIFSVDPTFSTTKQGTILIILEAVTMFFHLAYCVGYITNKETMNQRQSWKWLEYAVR